jgi:hypothetical protein
MGNRILRTVEVNRIFFFALMAIGAFATAAMAQQPAAPSQQPDDLLKGVIDFHCHSGPDVLGRSINDFELVRQAKAAGMRAIVLKNHYTMTADRAQLAMQEIGGIEVFGGITLNLSVGGLNAEAVRKMVQMDGRRGRIVWLPTYDGEAQVRQSGENRPFVAVVKDGKPVPEMDEILALIAQHNLIFETGHSAADESLVLIAAARKLGISKIIVTHALSVPGGATDDQVKQMADMGATIECTWLAQLSAAQTQPARGGAQKQITVAEYARVIRLIGAEHVLISSDMGQMQNPPHVKAMRSFILALKDQGLSDEQIDLVARKNPAKLLGLDP